MSTDFINLHGVFIRIFNVGTLLTGPSGIGKSEAALGLISNGHALIADDAPQFHKTDGKLLGSCPEMLQDFLQVRNLGVLNIRAMFGDQSISSIHSFDLIITLNSPQINQDLEHIQGKIFQKNILGVNVSEIQLAIDSTRNITVLIEACVRKFLIQQQGFDAYQELEKRQQHQVMKCQ